MQMLFLAGGWKPRMKKTIFIILVVVALQMIGVVAQADMVILKSGEIFQTRKAWRENGSVCFYRNGRVARYPESDVERVIENKTPAADQPSTPDRPTPAPGPAPIPTPQPLIPRQAPEGDAGFLGLKWEQSPSQIEGLRSAGTDAAYGGVQLYTIGKKNNRFGRANVDNIFLGFWQGGLYTILIEVSNYLDFTELKLEAFRRFGTGQKDSGNQDRYRWSDSVSDRLLSFDDNEKAGYLWMRSHALHQKVRARYPE